MDAATKAVRGLKGPTAREDAKPPHPNPIRAFRHELRLTRDEFADLLDTPRETVRSWEREGNAVVPTGPRLTRLLRLAQKNKYPLYYKDICEFCRTDQRKKFF